jgi:hypothetical protein
MVTPSSVRWTRRGVSVVSVRLGVTEKKKSEAALPFSGAPRALSV